MARSILVARIESPLGPLIAGSTRDGVCMLEFSSRKRLEAQLAALRRRFHATVVPGRNAHLEKLERQLAGYFAGRRRRFSVRLVVPGSPFQTRVWREGAACGERKDSFSWNVGPLTQPLAGARGRGSNAP